MVYVTALLSTSVALGTVSEAFGVSEIQQHDWSRSAIASIPAQLILSNPIIITVPEAPPTPFVGPERSSNPSDVARGARFLQQLSLVPASGVAIFLASHADAVTQLLAVPPAASSVGLWWTSLDPKFRLAVSSANPGLVGNLDGIPFAVRNAANRALLDTSMAALTSTIDTDRDRTAVEHASAQLAMLQSILDALGGPESNPSRTLMTLDVSGQGRAAIVLGDLLTADYVSFLVPGMFFTIQNQMGDWVDASTRLYDEQLSWLALFAAGGTAGATSGGSGSGVVLTASAAPTTVAASAHAVPAVASIAPLGSAAPINALAKSVAIVAWIGYHTPDLTNIGGIGNADEGRDALAGAIEGLQAVRVANEPYTTIIAHSYGSTAALMALTEYSFQVDALAVVGSPGSPAKSAAELHVRDGNVFVGEAIWDPIPHSSYFGSDPGSQRYGAKRMGVNGGLDSLTAQSLASSVGHNDYFSPGSESMRNFALIAINKGQFVTP